MRRWLLLLAGLALGGAAGCGKAALQPTLPGALPGPSTPPRQGVIALATKNTTRLGGADAAVDAASVALAVYPGLTTATRPQAVVLVDDRNWPAALAAAALAGAPLGAPLLYAHGDELPAATAHALRELHPLGAAALGGAQVIRIGTTAAVPPGYRARTLVATAAALASLHRPAIYVLGAPGVSASTVAALGRLGRVSKIAPEGAQAGAGEAADPVTNAVAVSRFSDGSFGWGIREAGHGLVFLNPARALDAPAAAPLSAHGDYGPLLLLADRASLPPALARYLSNIEPGYTAAVRPVREVYNHGWLIGDESAISALAQAEIDSVLEVAPRTTSTEPSPAAPE
jgi:hypothetical protein